MVQYTALILSAKNFALQPYCRVLLLLEICAFAHSSTQAQPYTKQDRYLKVVILVLSWSVKIAKIKCLLKIPVIQYTVKAVLTICRGSPLASPWSLRLLHTWGPVHWTGPGRAGRPAWPSPTAPRRTTTRPSCSWTRHLSATPGPSSAPAAALYHLYGSSLSHRYLSSYQNLQRKNIQHYQGTTSLWLPHALGWFIL